MGRGLGKLGSALGAAAGIGAGIALAPATGGISLASLGGIAGLGTAGASLGGIAGELAKPTTIDRQAIVSPKPQARQLPTKQRSALDRRREIQSQNPLLTLQNALEALPEAPEPLQQEYLPPLLEAYSINRKNIG